MDFLVNFYKTVLTTAKVCTAKSEEEFQGMMSGNIQNALHDEREAVIAALDAVKQHVMTLKVGEFTVTVPSAAGEPTMEWQEVCRFIRERELKVFSNFFRCTVAYMNAFEKAHVEKK